MDTGNPPDSAPISRIRLLIVDGDPQMRAALRTGLEPRFEVTEASTAEEALFLVGQRWFSVILADYELIDQNGAWFLERVGETLPLARRVLMSNRGVPNVAGLRDAGIFDLFMAKPVTAEVFSAYFKTSADMEQAANLARKRKWS